MQSTPKNPYAALALAGCASGGAALSILLAREMKASAFAVVLNLHGFTDQLGDVLLRERDERASCIGLHGGDGRHC